MAKKTTVSSAAASVATLSGTDATRQDDASTISTVDTSNSSGATKPDETNSMNTPQSSGDAAGNASADQVKPQANFDPTEANPAEAKNQTPATVVEASASGTISDASQGAEEGAGANASLDPLTATLQDVLNVTATASFSELLGFVSIGQELMNEIEVLSLDHPDLEHWLGDDHPANIVRDLVEENAVLKDISDSKRAKADGDEKRFFSITKTVRLNNELLEVDDFVPLTKDQHKDVSSANACDPDWNEGE